MSDPTEDDRITEAREALAEALHYALRRDDWGAANDDERQEMLEAADALTAKGYTLPDAETPTDEWEYGVGWENPYWPLGGDFR